MVFHLSLEKWPVFCPVQVPLELRVEDLRGRDAQCARQRAVCWQAPALAQAAAWKRQQRWLLLAEWDVERWEVEQQ